MGRILIARNTVTEFEPPHRYVRTFDGTASGETQQLAESVDAGVKVSVIFKGELTGFLSKLTAPLVRGQIRKQMENDLNNFKAFIEG
jgi:carbon monoxide dehydrogenase subunit G